MSAIPPKVEVIKHHTPTGINSRMKVFRLPDGTYELTVNAPSSEAIEFSSRLLFDDKDTNVGGVTIASLLAVLVDRISQCQQSSEADNAKQHIQEALMWIKEIQ